MQQNNVRDISPKMVSVITLNSMLKEKRNSNVLFCAIGFLLVIAAWLIEGVFILVFRKTCLGSESESYRFVCRLSRLAKRMVATGVKLSLR